MPLLPTSTHGFAPQQHMETLFEAVNERLAALNAIGLGTPSIRLTGDLIADLIAARRAVESMADGTFTSAWVRTESADLELYDGVPDKGQFYLDAFGSRAGWRRTSSWWATGIPPIFSRGRAEVGDILGYWIWDDTISALRLMTHSNHQVVLGGYQEKKISGTYTTAEANAAWSAAQWQGISPALGLGRRWRARIDVGVIEAEATRAKMTLQAKLPIAAKNVVFWVRPQKLGGAYHDVEGAPEGKAYMVSAHANVASGTEDIESGYTFQDERTVANPLGWLFTVGGAGWQGSHLSLVDVASDFVKGVVVEWDFKWT